MSIALAWLQSLGIFASAWLLWKVIRGYYASSTLDKVPGPTPKSLWKGETIRHFVSRQAHCLPGNFPEMFHLDAWDFYRDLTQSYGPVVKLHGLFGQKLLYVFDPTALHNIVLKEQHIYEEVSWFLKTNMLLFGCGLLSTSGDHHRKQRKMLNPVFSISHMREMIPIFYDVTHRLEAAISARVEDGPQELDILKWLGRTALELIGQGGLGYSFDPLIADVPDDLGDAHKALGPKLARLMIYQLVLPYVIDMGPPALRRRLLDWFPDARVREVKKIVYTIYDRSKQIYLEKKAALARGDEAVQHQIAYGKDIMSILMKANLNAAEADRMEDEELVGQMSTLVSAATDTTSNALSRIMLVIAENQDAQERLRAEIREALNGEHDLPYDKLMRLPYLDAVCRETLRLYPPAPLMFREAREDVIMPLSEPIQATDGRMMTEILVPKGTYIQIGIQGSNWNKTVWGEDALEWKPERWLSPLPPAVEQAKIPGVYSNQMTFMGGSRACIGFSFAQMEMKVILSVLLTSFRFELPKQRVVWNNAVVSYPTMGKNGLRSQMLLKISPLGS
ncbi:cytochrome P450 [Obba rivulosa]|uniref:Cytochrome P450 n=1 Tax=Obba rivulosa TaxID=1052685 RepID=A0A8E2B066_9APHY|nr:cytochrome P450 [Obba rivulosa]